MSTQATTWPKGLYPSGEPVPITSATGRGKAASRPLALKSAFEHAPAIVLSAFFAAEVAFIVGGLGLILASLASLAVEGAIR